MRRYVRALAVVLAAVLVFGAAKYLDNGPVNEKQELPAEPLQMQPPAVPETESQAEETSPVAEASEETAPPETEGEPQRFLLTFLGDCTLGCRDSHSYIDLGFTKVVGDDYSYPFRNVIRYMEEDDFTFLNLEGVFCDEGYAVNKAHTFRGPTSYVNILTQNSVEMVTLANNHTMDYSQAGYDSTLATLQEAGVAYVERDKTAVYTTENGLTIGVYGAVYYLLDAEVITAEIAALKEQVDLVIFAPHWGIEKNYNAHEDQMALGRAAIDAGADIVYGCHPHVLQPIEKYGDGIIYYSLGNFSFGGNIYPDDYDSALIQQEVFLNPDGSVTLGETLPVPVCISSAPFVNNYQPTPYGEGTEEYDRVLAKLDGTWRR